MTFTSDERREVARNLREIEERTLLDVTDGELIDLLAEAVDLDSYEGDHFEGGLLYCLADLIDRPAIKPEPSGRAYWRCPRCGAFNYRSAVTDCYGVIPAHYCPNCGAEVVPDAERRD